jgi:hypothetical protein
MGAIIPGTVPRIIATLLFAEVRVVSENGRGLYTRSGRRIAKLPISPSQVPSGAALNSPRSSFQIRDKPGQSVFGTSIGAGQRVLSAI